MIGKIGMDIRDGKCGWLVVQALGRASHEQKQLIHRDYARDEDEAEARIKQLYEVLNIQQVYHQHEREALALIIKEINLLTSGGKGDKQELRAQSLPSIIFYEPLSNVYKRNK